jgi:elongation factor Ts
MAITAQQVKELREKTGAGMMNCKMALEESGGDQEKAVIALRKKGLASAQKKASRVAAEGIIGHYIHGGGTLGVLVEVNCETDFAARSDEFQGLVKDIAMHICAQNPTYVSRDDVPEDEVAREKEIYREQARSSGKSDNIVDKIAEGKISAYFKMSCLIDQEFVKNPSMTVRERIDEVIGKVGENIRVRRFVRFKTGEGIEKRSTGLGGEVQELLNG